MYVIMLPDVGREEVFVVLGYIGMSTEAQDVRNQRHEILEYANSRGYRVDEFVEIEIFEP